LIAKGVKLAETADTFDPSRIRFMEPVEHWWTDGALIVAQWE
jgi:hypothetical protein